MRLNIRTLLMSSAMAVALSPAAFAQVLEGRVTDATGTAPLQGAIVTISEIGRTAVTGREGDYRFSALPAGDYTLTVSYVGAEPVTTSVNVPSAGAKLDLTLGGDFAFRDNILIVGSAAAQASAINQQRASDAIISVIDSDGLGDFPDTTVADSLQRIAGISIETDQGEGRYVSIRGLNTDLISASINGVRTPSPEDRRGVLLDGVPSDLLDSIEVQKSLTPNVDGDSIGGVINLKTLTAFDRDGRFVRGKVEGAYNDLSEEISPKGTLTYTEVFGDVLGVAISANYQDLRIISHNNETGGWDFNEDFNVFTPSDDYEQRFYDLTRERVGLVANIDYRGIEGTDLYARVLWNRYADDEVRNKFEFREFDEEQIAADADSVSIRRGEVDAEVRLREEIRRIQTYALGGNTFAGPWSFNYEASYAYAEEDDSNNHDVAFRSGPEVRDDVVGALTLDYSNPETPVVSGLALPFLLDPTNYEMDAYEQEFTFNKDTEWSGKFDVARDSMVGSTPVEWRGGVKLRDRTKKRDQNLAIWERDLELPDFITPSAEITNWRFPNAMFGWPDPQLTAALRGTFGADELALEDTALESLSGDYQINERILAGFAMGTFDLNATTIVAGVRVESTETDSTGSTFVEGDGFSAVERDFSDDYTEVLPSLNIKHSFTDRLVGRAAAYRALVRPAFGEMAPRALFNEDQDEVEIGNPDLAPYLANNFDLSIEFYPGDLSVLSFGVFSKQIDNAIYPATFDIADLPGGIDLSFIPATTLAGIEEVSTFINSGASDVTGVELNYVQQFGFLPGPWDGLLVSANVTLTDSESELPDGTGFRTIPLLKQNDTVWNLAVGYEKGPWDLRVSANYRGEYLDEIFGAELDRYADERTLVEASAKYDVNDFLQVYVEGKNLTDAPEYYYHGSKSRLSQYDEFGKTVIVGFRGTY